jgi:L-rhamnose mutarotase
MKRHAFKMRIPPQHAAEYRRRHDEIWPTVLQELKAAGISDYSIYLDEDTGDLFGVMKIRDPRQFAELAEKEIMKKWWAMNTDIQVYEQGRPFSRDLNEVFHME